MPASVDLNLVAWTIVAASASLLIFLVLPLFRKPGPPRPFDPEADYDRILANRGSIRTVAIAAAIFMLFLTPAIFGWRIVGSPVAPDAPATDARLARMESMQEEILARLRTLEARAVPATAAPSPTEANIAEAEGSRRVSKIDFAGAMLGSFLIAAGFFLWFGGVGWLRTRARSNLG